VTREQPMSDIIGELVEQTLTTLARRPEA